MATRRASLGGEDRGRRGFWDQASHDFRQPIQSLQLLAQVFSRHAESEAMRQGADHMRRAVADLAQMHDDLTRLLRIEEGRSESQSRGADLSRLVHEIVRDLSGVLADAKVDVRTDSVATISEADREWLSVILRGMILLAVTYSDDGPIRIEGDTGEGETAIAISFGSPGIPATEAERVFVDGTGSGQARPIPGPRYLSRACELLGYRFDLGEAGQGRQSLRLTIPSTLQSRP